MPPIFSNTSKASETLMLKWKGKILLFVPKITPPGFWKYKQVFLALAERDWNRSQIENNWTKLFKIFPFVV